MFSLGINIGSSSLKAALLDGEQTVWSTVVPHDGDLQVAIREALATYSIPEGVQTLVTGTEGRYLFNINNTIEPVCVEEGLRRLGKKVDAVVSMGGEDLVVYTIDENGKIVNNFSGNKCASGTGEFFKQQLARMDMKLADVEGVPEDARVLSLSTRCSVFMKSDCTHRLNKSEATKEDIVLSLSNVMAIKVIDFLKRAKIHDGTVLLTGGITKNRHILRFIRENAPEIDFIVPPEAPYFEAFGAAHLAKTNGSSMPSFDSLLKPNKVRFGEQDDLKDFMDKVTYFDAHEGTIEAGKEYILGVDGGSTTTKACLIDFETHEIVASHYGRTHGDPVKSLKVCLEKVNSKVKQQIGDNKIEISMAATTGSSREILGVFLETEGVYNEIIAHSVGTTFFSEDVETIFEIGGQDAKYVLLKNGVPIDYSMNEACSAGTGSFLEESAQGDLNIGDASEIGDIALKADAPLKFGEHCSAFINSDIRKAIQQGATRSNITAGIVTSIVSNYLNRVVGNRTIGGKIFLQGGVAKNNAIPLAFAMLLNKEILVPPSPELMGCFGVGLLAKQKYEENLQKKRPLDIESLIQREIVYERVFTCKACDNYCPIQVLNVNGNKYMFGGRCNKYTNLRKKAEDIPVFDYVAKRQELLYNTCSPDPETFVEKRPYTVGIPRAFSVHTLYPLYSWFFHTLGIKTVLSDTVEHEGVARAESTYCFPAEIAHGAVQDIINKGADYIFLPHFRDMPSYEDSIHANFCPITQGLPYYIQKAFPDVPEDKLLPLVVSFKYGTEKALEFFIGFGERLGIPAEEIETAFYRGYEKQEEYFSLAREMGKEALEEARKADRPVIALLGRPYNAFTGEANMGIPRKFTTRGYSVIPFDILPYESEDIFPNMYWYYGQQDMKAASLLKNEDNIYITFISNFSCAPDSFMLHYVKWLMGTKPFLILELDSHSADAGIDTRVEAFLDIIEGYRSKREAIEEERYDNGYRFVNTGDEEIHISNVHTGEKIPVKNNKRVKVILSNMGAHSTDLLGAVLRSAGLNTETMPVATFKTLQAARSHASGKECVPSHLVLGGALEFFASEKYRKDELYLLFVPITTGPCRTGQYYVFFENLFRDLRLENVIVFTMSADNSYNELGSNFSKDIWLGLVAADYMKDVQTSLRACAVDPKSAVERYNTLWDDLIEVAERDITKIRPNLKKIANEVAKIPLKKRLDESPKVLVVGEIYVRRDDFAVDELVELLSARGIVTKISGICEWVHYLDFVREYEHRKRLKLVPFYKRLFSAPMKDLVKLKIEELWKHHMERRIKSALTPSGMVPHSPHDMKEIMANSQKHFVNYELNSEIAVSSGVAATAMDDGYSGVVNISPFACLIGRVIEGVYTPWARERNYPFISVEVDGNLLPPNIISKLNIFMVNVLRFRADREAADLIETSNSLSSELAMEALGGGNGGNGSGKSSGGNGSARVRECSDGRVPCGAASSDCCEKQPEDCGVGEGIKE
ncbi:MAG: acyl-CoA dehydratase activase [Spirochaetaceae bacterium]